MADMVIIDSVLKPLMILSPLYLALLIKNGSLNRRRWATMILKVPVIIFMIYTIWDFIQNKNISRTFWCVLIFSYCNILDSFDFMLFVGFLNSVIDEVLFFF